MMAELNDFTVPLATLIDALETRVRLGVEQPGSVAAIFKRSIGSYELPADTIAVGRVAGMRGQRYTVFVEGVDYAFGGARLQWIGVPADEGARLDIETIWREPPSGLTDFNQGSVAGTLLRAVARELALMYAQMDEAYRRAFIDDANGAALDRVVALLGVQRIAAQPAAGSVTFLRKKAADAAVTIPAGTRVADKAGRTFATRFDAQIRASAEELRLPAGRLLLVTDRIAALIGVWPKAQDPDATLPLAVEPGFGASERAITLAAPPPAGELRIRYRPRSVTVAVQALQPGPDGNVNAGSLTIMPTPPRDVDAVTNEDATQGGQVAEADERLRERAKHALERAGNATPNAIRFAVLQVEGVQGVEVLDHLRDDAIPLGEVRVRHAGGDPDQVREAVEATRAAGVMARVEQIVQVTLDGTFYLVPAQAPQPGAGAAFVADAVAAMNALQIGQPLALRKLQAAAFTLPGLADLLEAQLAAHRPLPSSPGVPVAGDTVLVAPGELIRPAAAGLQAVLLAGLVASGHRRSAPGVYQIDLQIRDAGGGTPDFAAAALDLFVAARARLQSNPTETPLRVGSFTRRIAWAGAAIATLTIDVAADLPDFDPAQHEPAVQFVLAAAAYPGLEGASVTFDVTA